VIENVNAGTPLRNVSKMRSSPELAFVTTIRLGAEIGMRLDDTNDMRLDILDWSDPVVGDCLFEAYDSCFGGNMDLSRPMTRQHARVWRLIISGDKRRAAEARRDLLRMARTCRMGSEAVDAIDRLVLDELVDVMAARFRASPNDTRHCGRVLIEASATLVETRHACAA